MIFNLKKIILFATLFASHLGLAYSQNKNIVTIFVSKEGNPNNDGTKISPLASLQNALDKLRLYKNGEQVTIYFRGGEYVFDNSVVMPLGGEKSYSSLAISGYDKEEVVFTGGRMLAGSGFHAVEDSITLHRLSQEARKMVKVIDLTKIGVKNFGELKKYGFGESRVPVSLEVFYDDSPLMLARWPNDTLIQIGEVISKGARPNANNTNKDFPKFKYLSSRPQRWSSFKDIWVGGHFSVGWSDDYIRVDSINVDQNILSFKDYFSYGITQNDEKSKKTENLKWLKNGKGFYFYNVFEELDKPGEWYLDREKGFLYLWPPSDIVKSRIEISLLEQPFIKAANIANLSINDITFSTSRGDAIQIEKSSNLSIKNCKFLNLGLQAIMCKSSTNVQILNCYIVNTGSGGININGGDRKTLTSSNNVIEDCEFANFSRLYRSYSPAITLGGVGILVQDCYIHDAPDHAIWFNGNNHKIVNNHVKTVCKEFDDTGAVTTGRDPSSTGTVIENNFFEDIQNDKSDMVAAVYIDDGSGGIDVNNNLFYKCGGMTVSGLGTVHVHGGAYNNFKNNIFIDCAKAFSNTSWSDRRWIDMYLKDPKYVSMLTKTVDIRSQTYLDRYPHLRGFFDSTNIQPRKNYIINAVANNVTKFSTGTGYVEENVILITDEKMVSGILRKKMNLGKNVLNLPGWKSFNFELLKN